MKSEIQNLTKKLASAKKKLSAARTKHAIARTRSRVATLKYDSANRAAVKLQQVMFRAEEAEDKVKGQLDAAETAVRDYQSDLKHAKKKAAEARRSPQNGVTAAAQAAPPAE